MLLKIVVGISVAISIWNECFYILYSLFNLVLHVHGYWFYNVSS